MIKKIIACLTICFIITGIISPVFSYASALPQPNWSDPGISEIINISDLTGWMLNGGTFDVSTYTDSESFMNDYFFGRTSTRLVDGNDLYYNQFGIGQDLYNIGSQSYNSKSDTVRLMSSSFREHSGYGRRFSEQANLALLDSGNLYDMKIPLLNEVEFANFVGYNHDALRLYSEFFKNDSDIVPNPDPNYISYLDVINGSGFWFKDFQDKNGFGTTGLKIYPPNLVSWYSRGSGSGAIPFVQPAANSLVDCWCCEILDCYIVSNNDVYSFSMTPTYIKNFHVTDNDYTYYGAISTYSYGGVRGGFETKGSDNLSDSTISYSGTLSSCLNYLQNYCRNINIYVDGVPWSLVSSQPTSPNITPEFPDAVGGEELETTTWPISRPRAPYYTSVPGMLQAIEDAIEGDGKLDIDDLKPYLTDENGDPVPDPIFDPEPVPIPVPDPVNPDVVPGLPVLPAIPLDMPGFNGVSVLAEIINFTNQSLPTSLIITFWGIVFGIVILGLIKILHK